ncbi:hypothetical protein KSD_85440 [Ktedonobacter sp. SOSP1-85]|uniref:hypothetical protein n=1 Tax=Ktedonobacter sp. SOSP1-85 TaxID=2778367 RepID=UPI0019169D19|nr:hypothetical protein [Ktedonobacter sp. SOSP1-85]GHO80773.1 hypothetical protein KSD_85440 [Ktedonobacter sp. SOSP1-85]
MSTLSPTNHSSYRAYEMQSASEHQEYEMSSIQKQDNIANEKVRPPRRDMRNIYRFILAITSMLMLTPFALLFVVFMGGPQGWIGFGIAAGAIFLIAVVAIDKIE